MANDSRCDDQGAILPGQEVWWVYIVTYIIIYVLCLGTSCLVHGIYFLNQKYKKHSATDEKTKLKKFHELVRQLTSGDTVPSKILIAVTCACNLIYTILAVYRAYWPNQVYNCFSLSQDPARIVELLVVLELIAFALIRLLASNNIVLYWLDVYTIVDVITLPHIFVSIALGIDWLGVRSARFLWLTQLISVVRSIPFILSQDIIDFFSLLIYFTVLLFVGTGIVHLLEISGDPWFGFTNSVTDNQFFTYAYYIVVTITTVGYGDISPQTTFGRGFMVVYIIIGLAFFAALLPIISDVISSLHARRQYARFDRTRVPRHVIVCGHITAFSAQEFLKDFLHPDRGDKNTHILFLHPTRPNRELKNVLRCYYTRVQYIAGSVLNSRDLRKCKIFNCSAVFILADKYTNIPLEEDNGNLLRLVSIKNTTTRVQVIIQLLLGRSKKQVRNIEGWNSGTDIAVCLNELKLGLLAQSCVCPGFSTLIANLFYTSDFPALASFDGPNAWKEGYIRGASYEIYTTHFSPSFNGKNFQQVAHTCYNKLGLILLALDQPEGELCKLHVNPSSPDIVIQSGASGSRGYFIGQDISHVSIVNNYCEKCDGDAKLLMHDIDREVEKFLSRITKRKCNCFSDLTEVTVNPLIGRELIDMGRVTNHTSIKSPAQLVVAFSGDDDYEELEELNEQYSIYLSEPKKLEETVLSSDFNMIDTGAVDLEDHIVLCIFADDKSPLLGLHNFLCPLRSKNIPKASMKSVVIISNHTFLKREWPFIRKIPDVYVVDGSPLRIQNLEAASVKSCSVCIIITMLSAKSDEPAIDDKEVVLCSLSIQKYLKRNATRQVQIITDLRQESNVQFLDFGDEDEPDERIYKAQPFACGEAFSVSMMDSVTSSAFYNRGTLYLVEDLIQTSGKASCQIVAVPLDSEEYVGKTFRDFYNSQLEANNLTLGLYRNLPTGGEGRQRKDSIVGTTVHQLKHYVVTAPNPSTALKSSDIAFVLVNVIDEPSQGQTRD